MGKWGPTRWLLRRWAAVTRRDPQPHFIARLNEIGSESGTGPRPDFRARLREEVLAAYRARSAPAPETPPRRPSLLRRVRPAAMIVAMVGVMFFTGVRTYDAVPGDHLYPIKRAAEATLLSLTTDDTERARRELNAAHSRATEAAALLGYPDSAREKLIGRTLDEMSRTTRSALTELGHVKRRGKQTPALKRFTEQQRDVVEPMIPQLGEGDRMKASAYLDMIDDLTP
ncbi:hypothetical protein DQ384_16710 [Sphaerisporangium album]|uniref:DUF5667 domain-containing protein n=1 Tax=Sphaerisporangium album TaxID=509200 RepID=A0A367FL63_9ACTN|nr:DUF5667 domain-containing protein [Sphaerisporangium album]RCG30365.1 hypothetical protein DQ384_16710 [Sphaerisporangium album]